MKNIWIAIFVLWIMFAISGVQIEKCKLEITELKSLIESHYITNHWQDLKIDSNSQCIEQIYNAIKDSFDVEGGNGQLYPLFGIK